MSGAYSASGNWDIGSAGPTPCRTSTKLESGENSLLWQRRGWRARHTRIAAEMDCFYWIRRSAVVGVTTNRSVADHRGAERVRHGRPRHCQTGQKCLQNNQSGRKEGDRTVVPA